MIVGKGGAEIEKLQETVSKMIGKPVAMSIVEVRSPDLNAQLVAENIAAQLEKRISHRRAMKMAMQRAMKLGAKGIKVNASGRLGGREIAGSEHYHEGTIPLQTLRADIDYGFAEAKTTAGRIGIKVWLYKGEVLTGGPRSTPVEAPRRDRRDRRDGDRRNDRRERRDGDRAPRRDGGRFGERKQFSAGPRGPQGRPYQRPAAEAPKTEGGAN
jgi:small subunit ribosomal protein S3